MRSPWTTGGLQKEGIATMTTGKRDMATVTMVISKKWNFLETGRTAEGVQTGTAGQRADVTGLSTTEAGHLPDTGAGIAAGTYIEHKIKRTETLLNEINL